MGLFKKKKCKCFKNKKGYFIIDDNNIDDKKFNSLVTFLNKNSLSWEYKE